MACGLALMMGFVLIQNFDSPYQVGQHHRLLAALAHQPVDLAARLPLHPAGRQPPGPSAHLRQPDDRHAARRPVARRELELRAVGRDSRRHARASSARRAKHSAYRRLPRAAAGRDHVPRRLPLLGVLPRQDARAGGRATSTRCSASRAATAASDAVAGAMYTPLSRARCSSWRRSSSGACRTPGPSPLGSSPARGGRRRPAGAGHR